MTEVVSGSFEFCVLFLGYRYLRVLFFGQRFWLRDVISVILVNGRLDKATAMRQKELAEFSPKPIANADAMRSWFYRQYKGFFLQLSLAICCMGLTGAGSVCT